jgi:excisionase family DNA binding protein
MRMSYESRKYSKTWQDATDQADGDLPSTQPLLTTGDVANRLNVSVATVYRLASAGRLRKINIGGSTRFAAEDVDSLVGASNHG